MLYYDDPDVGTVNEVIRALLISLLIICIIIIIAMIYFFLNFSYYKYIIMSKEYLKKLYQVVLDNMVLINMETSESYGHIVTKFYNNNNNQLHSVHDQPAYIVKTMDNVLIEERWYNNGIIYKMNVYQWE